MQGWGLAQFWGGQAVLGRGAGGVLVEGGAASPPPRLPDLRNELALGAWPHVFCATPAAPAALACAACRVPPSVKENGEVVPLGLPRGGAPGQHPNAFNSMTLQVRGRVLVLP